MTVQSESLNLQTQREGEVVDITDKIQDIVSSGGIKSGIALLFVPGSTVALTTLEYEPGLVIDLPRVLERLAPKSAIYEHEKQRHDGKWTIPHVRQQ